MVTLNKHLNNRVNFLSRVGNPRACAQVNLTEVRAHDNYLLSRAHASLNTLLILRTVALLNTLSWQTKEHQRPYALVYAHNKRGARAAAKINYLVSRRGFAANASQGSHRQTQRGKLPPDGSGRAIKAAFLTRTGPDIERDTQFFSESSQIVGATSFVRSSVEAMALSLLRVLLCSSVIFLGPLVGAAEICKRSFYIGQDIDVFGKNSNSALPHSHRTTHVYTYLVHCVLVRYPVL